MGRKSVEADETQLDSLDQACLALEIDEEKCSILREACQQICQPKKTREKKASSKFNIFMSKCMKEKKSEETVQERFRNCARSWRETK